jgi:glycosyltransferase involved in cell wall biosynthesis
MVVGARPPRRLRALAAGQPGVTIAGYVPDLAAVLDETTVLVVPLSAGGGVRVKILEAFATGLPVVSTPAGAAGLGVVPGRELLVATEPERFAEAVVRVATDPEVRERLVRNARAFVGERHSREATARAVRRLYRAVEAAP